MSMTYADALSKVGVTVPDHLIADAEVPVLTGPQAQGDLLIVPITHTTAALETVSAKGVQVVFGEATGNSHWLHQGFDSPGVEFARVQDGQRIAVVKVPDGQSAQLIHTDEHGSNAMGPGLYGIHEKREMAEEIRRVTD
ncbi:hypothetical protein [Pseudactinotalea sp.]|uniref:hypothetical protein n=1 Tax=Pseudactinotalea sp. TaxID=1926260 RepID=UPI003B3AE98C